ncbi:unnamed protein product [Amoebophrya sp. A120]|nr:unnamed protein product [Amoebophrya sp. A120]|eukprot:GSA120T00022868001.1
MLLDNGSSFLTEFSWGEEPQLCLRPTARGLVYSQHDNALGKNINKPVVPPPRTSRRSKYRGGARKKEKSRQEIVLEELEKSYNTDAWRSSGCRSSFSNNINTETSSTAIRTDVSSVQVDPFVARELRTAAPRTACDPGAAGGVPESRVGRKRLQIENMVSVCYEQARVMMRGQVEEVVPSFRSSTCSLVDVPQADELRPPRAASTTRTTRSTSSSSKTFHVVEFCAGSGHVAFPLLWVLLRAIADDQEISNGSSPLKTFPSNTILDFSILDMSGDALATAGKRIRALEEPILREFGYKMLIATGNDDKARATSSSRKEKENDLKLEDQEEIIRLRRRGLLHGGTSAPAHAAARATKVNNEQLFIFVNPKTNHTALRIRLLHCMVAQFPDTLPLDLAIALHACGRASDEVMALAAARSATFVVAPCCVGRLAQDVRRFRGNHDINAGPRDVQLGGRAAQVEAAVPEFCLEVDIIEPSSSTHKTTAAEQQVPDLLPHGSPEKGKRKHWNLSFTYPRSQFLQKFLTFPDFCVVAKAADFASHFGGGDEEVEHDGQEGDEDFGISTQEEAEREQQQQERSTDPAINEILGRAAGENSRGAVSGKIATVAPPPPTSASRIAFAKFVVHQDRLKYVAEAYGYERLTSLKMSPSSCTPKNDILVGSPCSEVVEVKEKIDP